MDYGYLVGTVGGDGEGIDVWRGTGEPRLLGLVATFDDWKANAEVKYLFALTGVELAAVQAFYAANKQHWVLVERQMS